MAYIVGFLARAYLYKNPCEECQPISVNENKHLDFHIFLLYFKKYKKAEVGGLTWSSDDFFHYVKNLGKKYFECIDRYFEKQNVTKNICSVLQTQTSGLFNGHIHEKKAISFIILKFVTIMLKHKIKIFNLKNTNPEHIKPEKEHVFIIFNFMLCHFLYQFF